MFTFPILAVRKVVERGIADAAANGGFRNPYYGTRPGEGEQPGAWLVGDEGVYLMANGKLADGQKTFVIYAEECDPKTNPDHWHYKRQHFGADDGIEFLDAVMLVRLIRAAPAATHITIATTDHSLSITPFRR